MKYFHVNTIKNKNILGLPCRVQTVNGCMYIILLQKMDQKKKTCYLETSQKIVLIAWLYKLTFILLNNAYF